MNMRMSTLSLAALVITGCSGAPANLPTEPLAPVAEIKEITLHVPNMNKDLRIL